MKQHADISELLDRYWAGETTLDEERRLKAFFDAEIIPEQFRAEAPLFQALRAEQAVKFTGKAPKTHVIGAFRGRWFAAAAAVLALLCAGLFWWAGGPEPIQIAQTPLPTETPEPERKQPEPVQKPAAPEAPPTLALATLKPKAAKPRNPKPKPETEPAPEISDAEAEAALAEIKAALSLVSSKINRSKQTLDKGLQEVEHVDIFHKKKADTNG